MAWFPGATKMELQPESDAQPAITPTQLIFHSIAAAWTPQRAYEFWRDSTTLESHFGVGYDGSVAQYIGTETRADANYRANRRLDGTGAVSVETASNDDASDPWTPAQVRALIQIGVWMHQHHGIPLRICRSHNDPGYGFHRLYGPWADGGTDCPGDRRVEQFHDEVFPGIVAAATGQTPTTPESQGDEMPYTRAEFDEKKQILAHDVWTPIEISGADLFPGARSYSGTVYLTLTTPAGIVVQGRFYHEDAGGRRWYGPIIERIATSGASFVDFTHAGFVSEGESVRFEVTSSESATITARRVAGLYWK
ncbi:N-acetylmuramoyl-L-alanine amidase [Streptomyces sp. HU2014]|uniref:peptidoglycan recognition protein family protein n=1 Tax=Streptomyces sp. HU2014 TaxID=2939414 RepID=UPI00200E94CE|nr:N-acetylmuramoyl-L-alanine amidase [Streptomyces sp. HU2014]UQI46712.1 N-acetylmuramoyl-L-alanine amidase [Streptomyces sp. HU2014]